LKLPIINVLILVSSNVTYEITNVTCEVILCDYVLVFVMFLAYRFERCSVRDVFAELPAMLDSKIG